MLRHVARWLAVRADNAVTAAIMGAAWGFSIVLVLLAVKWMAP